jgi:hypothetical protein
MMVTSLPWSDLIAEAARELAYRRRVLPGQVDKGKLAAGECDRQIAIFAAIAEDLARFRDAEAARENPRTLPRSHAFSWADRTAALYREADMRARFYPGWIDKGRITAAESATQSAALAAIITAYETGADFEPPSGALPPWGSLGDRDPAAAADRLAWAETFLSIRTRRGCAPAETDTILRAIALDSPTAAARLRQVHATQEQMAL